jgi:hypothetical protein
MPSLGRMRLLVNYRPEYDQRWGGRPVVFEFSCCCAIVRVPMCHGVRRRRIMAVVHVQCPQCQSIEVVEYGKQANGTQR